MPWTARLQEAWVPGYKAKGGGAALPCRTGEGRTGRNQGSRPRAGCLQPLCRALAQWPTPGPPTGQAASHTPSTVQGLCPSEAAAPACAPPQAPW